MNGRLGTFFRILGSAATPEILKSIERGLNKNLSFSLCKYYEILIYSWLVWLTILGIQICRVAKPTS